MSSVAVQSISRRTNRFRNLPVNLQVGLAVVVVWVLAALMAPWITPADPNAIDLARVLLPPGEGGLMGTDQVGRDIFTRVIFAARIDLWMGLAGVLAPLVIGVLIGLFSGYFGGWTDAVAMRAVDITLAFPFFVLVLAIVAVLGPGIGNFIIALALVAWVSYARLVRAEVMVLRNAEFVEAARTLGFGPFYIMFRHVLPNTLAPVVVYAMTDMLLVILAGASLGFIGLGVQPPTAEWGCDDCRWSTLHPASLVDQPVSRPGGHKFRDRPVVDRGWAGTHAEGVELMAGGKQMLLSVEALSVSFGSTRVVHDVSFQLATGQVLGIVGESGSGKSVTLRAILGLLPKSASVRGNVCFDGREMLGMGAEELRKIRGKELSMIFQNPSSHLDPLMTIGRQVAEPLVHHEGMASAAARKAAIKGLGEVQLDRPKQRAGNYPHQLSGGMKQRAMIAAAIACKPRLLLADEPTTALDVTVQAHILELLAELNASRGLSIILVSHDLAVVAQVCDRILVMKDGQVVEQGEASAVIAAPQHTYTRLLLDSQPGRLAGAIRPSAPPAGEEPVLEVSDMEVNFRLPRNSPFRAREVLKAADRVSLQVRPGESLGIVGESGSGKSTVARAVMGLVEPAGGTISKHGSIQMAFQNPFDSLNPRFTVFRTIAEPLRKHHLVSAGKIMGRVEELMGLVELSIELADRNLASCPVVSASAWVLREHWPCNRTS